jgi:aryl-alcohol dehydrogenase-like predicted oxidoreductase
MRYTQVTGIDKPVSRIALGTMILNPRELDKSFGLLDDAFELGVTTLNTAHVYARGDSERAIGAWMEARQNRDKVVIVTKSAHPNPDRKRVTPFDISSDLFDSLARLRTDCIDVYLLHRDDPDTDVGTIVEALDEHRRAGRIKAFGGSNWSVERIRAANDYAARRGLIGFTASSPNYSLAEQVEDPWGPGCTTIGGPLHAADRQFYRDTQMGVFAYSSLARGLLSGRISRANFEAEKDALDRACRTAYCHEVNFQRLDRAEQLAHELGVSVPQIALAFVLNQGLNVVALVGAENRDEIASAARATEIELSAAHLDWLDLKRNSSGDLAEAEEP